LEVFWCDGKKEETGTGLGRISRRLGGIAYLRKPFDEQRLLDAIQLVCERGRE